MAGRLAFDPISVRTPSSPSQSPLKNYRPAFESIVLGRPSEGLDPSMVRSLGSIISAAYRNGDEKGVGGKVREIFADFAARIDNNIVKLASQRIGDVISGVRAEHLPEFLSAMHQEMLRSPDRADAIPEAMLNTYHMSAGRLGAGAIVRAVRVGFGKSRTLCPKEVTCAIRSEYESGGLDHISEVAAIRNEPMQSRIEIRYDMPGQISANDMPLPEAVPVAHFAQPKMPEELTAGISYLQEVPQIVASNQREEIRKRRKDAKIAEFRPSRGNDFSVDIQKPEAASVIALRAFREAREVRPAPVALGERPRAAGAPRTPRPKAETSKAPIKTERQKKPDERANPIVMEKPALRIESKKMMPLPTQSRPAEHFQSGSRRHSRRPKPPRIRRLPRVNMPAVSGKPRAKAAKRVMPRAGVLVPIVNLLRVALRPARKKEPSLEGKKTARKRAVDRPGQARRPPPAEKAPKKEKTKPVREKRAVQVANRTPKVKNAPRPREQARTCMIRKAKAKSRKEKPAEPMRVRPIRVIRDKMRRKAPGEIVFKLGF